MFNYILSITINISNWLHSLVWKCVFDSVEIFSDYKQIIYRDYLVDRLEAIMHFQHLNFFRDSIK